MGRVRAVQALGVLVLALLTGCSSKSDQGQLACPRLLPASGAQAIALFGPGGHTQNDVVVGGRIFDLEATCKPLKVGVDLDAAISFYAERANFDIKDATFPYFVALVDSDEKVLAEEQFQEQVPFLPGESYRRMPVEKVTVHLPLRNKGGGALYTVIVGFQLTPDQIAFNRSTRAQ